MRKRLEIALKPSLLDAEGEHIRRKVQNYFGWHVPDLARRGAASSHSVSPIRIIHVITFDADLTDEEFESVRREVFTNPVTQISSFSPLTNSATVPFQWVLWVGFRPGVRDTAGSVAQEAVAHYLGRPLKGSAYTSRLIEFRSGDLERWQIETIARELLANELIQQWKAISVDQWDAREGIGLIVPKVSLETGEGESGAGDVRECIHVFPMRSDAELAKLSKERNFALHPQDIPVIRAYFNRPEVRQARALVGLSDPTDVELEAISQARSDHCNHNTFRGVFTYRDQETGEEYTVDNLFKSCIEAPTLMLQREREWVVSVLWDNAGVAYFDQGYHYVITGETHNSPSNMEAYGGAITGIVGVYRDIMGTGKGARMVGGMYGYCVGPRDYGGPLKPRLHPRRLLDGIVEGVRDGGNKHGVPTLFGGLLFHPSYLGKCLVFVSSLGIMPAKVANGVCHEKRPEPGDLIVMCGGRVGKDGIHGVTASSEAYSEHTPVGHVQIGDPYTQKKMHDFLLEARDEGLIAFITDNGGGGLSSSVGESARVAGGALVELEKVPLKYEGLAPWEIWISESQERMTVGIKREHLERFMALSRKHEVESTVIGRYEGTGKLHLTYKGKTCAYLDLSFFDEAFPKWRFEAQWRSPQARGLYEPVLGEPDAYGLLLRRLLAQPNIRAHEWIHRQYDHEVQGASVVKYFVGRHRDMPSDAVVIRPLFSSSKGIAVTQALHPSYGIIDTYHMVAVTVDECVRRLLSVGGSVEKIGGVDNFCWPTIQYHPTENPDGRYKAAQLVRATWALRDICLAFGIPLLSGKDSMYVDGFLKGEFGESHKVSGLPAMQFTATTVVEEVKRCLSMEAKMPGDGVYVLGVTRDELGGSEYYELFGYTGLHVPRVEPKQFLKLYRTLEEAITQGLLASCHAVSRGGLGVHLALVAMAGWLGMEVDLHEVPREGVERNDHLLFSESAGRYVVTVAPEKMGTFEALFRGRSLPCARVGVVTEGRRFRLRGLAGELICDESIEDLREAWAGRPSDVPYPVGDPLSAARQGGVRGVRTPDVPPKALVLTGFGLNCDAETAHTLERAGARADRVHLNDIVASPERLREYQILVIGGGFSWGDDHGAGVIMARRLRDRLGDDLLAFSDRGGLILGICNGFQVLVNLGLLPGPSDGGGEVGGGDRFRREVALLTNDCGHFLDMWVWLKTEPNSPCVFTRGLDVIEFPIRHGEGKFFTEPLVLDRLIRHGQVALRYVRPDGAAANGQYPFNPNGSLMDIAGICDVTGRVMGLMPHPEAFHHWTNHPHWTLHKEMAMRRGESLPTEGWGVAFFRNAVRYLA